jgi:hypothetical protein
MRLIGIAGFGIVLCLSAFGCSAADKVQNKISCSDVCNRYKDCFNKDYDVDACTSRCETNANNSEDKDRTLDMCNTCIGDRSCASSVFNCADDCGGIVP